MSQMCPSPSCSRDNPDAAFTCAACGGPLRALLGSNTLLAGRYRVVRVLGCGGMGAVYLAEDLHIGGRQVALKENLDPAAQAQFQAEIALMTGLSHRGLPGISDQFVGPNGRQYLVMNFIPGETLQDAVTRRGALPESEVVALAAGLLDVLEYLHRNGIIHRDVKPENIKLAANGQPVLVDFGIAKQWIPGGKTQPWAHRVGTAGYAPPEQYAGGTDPRADLYALGAVMYFLVTAQTPPEATRLAAGAPLTPPRQVRPTLPLELQRVIFRAMAPAAAQRYQSAAEMRASLYNAVAPTGTWPAGGAPAGGAPTVLAPNVGPPNVGPPQPQAAGGSRGRWPVFAGVGVAVIVLAVLAGLARNLPALRTATTPATAVPVSAAFTDTPVLTATVRPPDTDTPAPTLTATLTDAPPTATATPEPSATRTPRPAPTETPWRVPSPTLTPRPYAEAGRAGAGVWEGPSEGYPLLAEAGGGERFLITGRNEDCTWFQVSIAGGRTGWVPAEAVNANVGPCDPPPAALPLPPTETPPPPPTPEPPRPTQPPAGLANNVTQFGDGQGRHGWWYQVERGRNSGLFEDFPSFGWYGSPTRNCWQTGQEAHVRICESGEVHPGVTGRIAYRWRSDTARGVSAVIHAHKIDTGCGDGVWVGVFQVPQGQEPRKVGEFAISGGEYHDRPANTFRYDLGLAAGDSIMVMVDIRGNSGCDQTRLYIDLY